VRPDHHRIGTALVEELVLLEPMNVRVRLQKAGAEDCALDDTSFYLTTETPDRQPAKSIIATRPKPEASTTRLSIGDRVVVAITSFTVLPLSEKKQV
jgi:hypothetical protein